MNKGYDMSGVSRMGVHGHDYLVGRGYVIIPPNVDRGQYIASALRSEKLAISLENGGSIALNTYITREAIQDIVFPETSEELGSCVSYITVPPYNVRIIVGIVGDEDDSQLLQEDEFRREKKTSSGIISISGLGRRGELHLDLDGLETENGGLFIKIKNGSRSAKMRVEVLGESEIYTEGKSTISSADEIELKIVGTENPISIRYKKGEGLTYTDEFENSITVNEDVVQIQPNSEFKLFEGEEAMIKGDALVTELEKAKNRIDSIISALQNSAVASGDGGATYKTNITTALASLEEEDYSEVKSTNSFL